MENAKGDEHDEKTGAQHDQQRAATFCNPPVPGEKLEFTPLYWAG